MILDLYTQKINSLNDRGIVSTLQRLWVCVSPAVWMGPETTARKDSRFIPAPLVFGQSDQAHKNFILCQKNGNTMTETLKALSD